MAAGQAMMKKYNDSVMKQPSNPTFRNPKFQEEDRPPADLRDAVYDPYEVFPEESKEMPKQKPSLGYDMK